MKANSFNQILILIEYGRLETSLYNNLEVLKECLNDLPQISTTIIVNKVPTERMLASKRKRGEVVPDRQSELVKTFEEISKALDNTFIYNLYLENEDYDDTDNEAKYKLIRRIIWESNPFQASQVRTWDEIVKFYEEIIDGLIVTNSKKEELVKNLEDKLDKIEFDIADIKYSYLKVVNTNHSNLEQLSRFDSFLKKFKAQDPIEFTRNFRCKYSEQYYDDKKPYDVEYISFFKNLSVENLSKNGKENKKLILKQVIKPFLIPYQKLLFSKENYNIINRLNDLNLKRVNYEMEYKVLESDKEALNTKIESLKEKIN